MYKKNDNILNLNLDDILQPYNVPKLDEPAAELLEGPIKDTEIIEVLKNMKNNKSPGSDGYTAEFFKNFLE